MNVEKVRADILETINMAPEAQGDLTAELVLSNTSLTTREYAVKAVSKLATLEWILNRIFKEVST